MSTGTWGLAPIGLEELTARAALMTRVDRKYLVPLDTAHRLVHALDGGLRVLEIDGRRAFAYRSTYYDSLDLVSYRGAATGRRRRFKVRRRDYLDTSASYLEVKTRTGRGESRKVRAELPASSPTRRPLAGEALGFVLEELRAAEVPAPEGRLLPVLSTAYDRTTLLLAGEESRLTIDAELTWTDLRTGDEVQSDEVHVRRPRASGSHTLEDLVVIETKAGASPGAADRFLWSEGHRPLRLSKYATGLALLSDHLAANRWARTLGALTVRAS